MPAAPNRRTLLAWLGSAPWAGACLAAGTAAPSASALAEDIDIAGELLQTLHPGLLRYSTADAVRARLAALRPAFANSPDLAGRYLLLSRFLATLRCGHSYANFFNQSPAVAAELFDRPTRLPFTFRWLGSEMVVTGAAAGAPTALVPGAVVEAIDGIDTATWWQRLEPYARVDGHNPGKARSLLSVTGRFKLEFFDIFHGLLAGVPPGGRNLLALRLPDGSRRSIEAAPLTMAQRHAGTLQAATTADQPAWTWQPTAEGVAVLTMPGWALYNTRWNWEAWLDERLDELHRSPTLKALVVDLRGNEGGLDCGDRIVQRFAREPSAQPMRRLVRFRRTPAHLDKVLDTWDDSFRRLGVDAQPVDERFFALPAADGLLPPRGPRIDKPLVVLTNGANSSATFGFAQRVRAAGLGPLVGEATGGNQRGINGGAFFFVRLPASGLEFDLPLIGTFPPGEVPDGGLAPDVPVLPTPQDIAAGRDVQRERAVALALAAAR